MLKEFLTYRQQMEKLRSSGLAIEDEEACHRVLADIGYFPVVNGYHRFPRPEHPGIPRLRHFWGHPGALRVRRRAQEIMLDALLKVEAKIRSVLAYEFCAAFGESQGKYLGNH